MFIDYFYLVIKNLKHRKLRSWLTIMGIFIGIAAIVSLISLGNGLRTAVGEQFEQMGVNTLTIMGKAGPISGPLASAISSKPLTTKDIEIIERINSVDFATGFLFKSVHVKFGENEDNLILNGIKPGDASEIFKSMNSFEIIEGRDLADSDKYKVVIGHTVANNLFEKKIGIRNKMLIDNKEFKVIGILKKIGGPDDSNLYTNIDVMRDLVGEPDLISIIIVKVKEGAEPAKIAEKIENELADYRGEKEAESFTVSTSEQLLETFGNIIGVVEAILIGITAISLLVGGIGIMNVMYTSVLERTKEVGIMKSVGAKNTDILSIFLIESGLLGLIGGIVGVILGYSFSKSVEFIAVSYGITLLNISISPGLIITALSFSFLAGILSGVLPAMQASRLKPTEALRYE